ncbi:MAG: DUF2190 family protein [Candidatus Bathyarchaeota archaeon]|nr:DUF2190 family protein [Candidatus Bathyarchaeota archaeon]
MTDFTDQVFIKIASKDAPDFYNPNDPWALVRKIWGFTDGKWLPLGFQDYLNNPNVVSYLTFAKPINSPPTQYVNLNLFEITTDGEPLFVIDRGVTIQKDITAGGFVGSNQGELWLGSGRANQLDIPKIILMHSDVSILDGQGSINTSAVPTGYSGSGSFPPSQSGTYYLRTDANEPYHNRVFKFDGSNWNDTTPDNPAASQLFRSTNAVFGEAADTIFKSSYDAQTGWSWSKVGPASDYAGRYFDTLYLTKLDGTPAHLDLGNLTVEGQLKLQSQNKKIFGVAAGDNYPTDNNAYLIPINPPDGGLGLGTATYPFKWVDATTVFTNEVNSLNYGGITLFDKLKFGGQNNDVYLDRAGTGVLQVYNSTGQAGTFNASNIFVDHINSLSGGAVTLYKPLGYPFTAGAAISAYRIVAMNANNTVVTANRSNATKQIGVAVADINSGQQGVIAYSGTVQVRAGMNLTAGMHVTTDDQGRAYQYSGHNHTITSLNIQNANIGAHNHQAGTNLQTSTQGNHSHGFPAGYAATDTQGAHQHGFPSGSAATDTVGNHSHGFPSGYAATDSQGSHSHGASSGSTNIAHTHGITMGSTNTGPATAGTAHTHSYAYSTSPTQSAGGSHNHSISTDSAGNHSHTVGGSTGYTGDHSHSVGGSTGSAGGHSHSVGGSTGSAGDHSH